MTLNRLSQYIGLALSTIIISHAAYALPFSITPQVGTPFPTTLVAGTTSYATYTVKNNTNVARENNYIKYLPPNVTVLQTGCTEKFNLAASGQPGDSCPLNLAITGAVVGNDSNVKNHLFVCFPGGISCAGTKHPLNIAVLSNIGSSGIPALAHINTVIYAGGLNSSNYGSMWSFFDNTWNTIFTGGASSAVRAITTYATNIAYFGGGIYNAGQYYSAWVYQYDANSKITTETGFSSGTSASKLNSLTMSGPNLYAGGIDGTGAQGQAWSFINNVWTSLSITNTSIIEVVALAYSPVQPSLFSAVINNGTGTISTNPYAQVQFYNAGTWTDTGLPTSDASIYFTKINTLAINNLGVVYAGGIDSNQHAAVWQYTGGLWSALTLPSSVAQSQIYSLAFNNEGVLFAGGFDGNAGQVWYYNSGNQTWTSMNLQGSSLIQAITIDTSDLLYAGGLAQSNQSGIWTIYASTP